MKMERRGDGREKRNFEEEFAIGDVARRLGKITEKEIGKKYLEAKRRELEERIKEAVKVEKEREREEGARKKGWWDEDYEKN